MIKAIAVFFKTQYKHWYLKELLCKSNEVTSNKERNTRMEKVLKRGAHTSSASHHGLSQMRMKIRCEPGGTEKHVVRLHKNTLHHEHNDGSETGKWLQKRKSKLREKRE